MDYELRVIIEKVSVGSQEVIKRDTLKIYDLEKPESILELGLRHREQISLLEKVQNVILAEQASLLDAGYKVCPKCGGKLQKNGNRISNFHAVFSDHQLKIQQHCCDNPDCDWRSFPTINSLLGTNRHPDLAKLQCEQGALYSFREGQKNLERLNCEVRSINNHTQIKRLTTQVGEIISEQNHQPPKPEECASIAEELVVQVDGGHIPIQDKEKRSFEALSAIIYQPKNLERIDKNHRKITQKACVASAQNDELKTMKAYMINAAIKQGLGETTKACGLADGAKNCWSVLLAIEPYCQSLECILDWFHIGKKFQNVKQTLEESFAESLESAKWELWRGKTDEALAKLVIMRDEITDGKKKSKLQGLYDYLARNRDYLVNYEDRKQANQTYTSQVAESHIESLINDRHKRSGKMQWTREGAHQVLQIRTKMTSNEWERIAINTVFSALVA